MPAACSHDIGRSIQYKAASRPGYSTRRGREVALLESMYAYVAERKAQGRASAEQERLIQTFNTLAAAWRAETAHLSSVIAKTAHPAYLRIIGMGQAVLPLILARLDSEPAYWFAALRSLTGQNPVRAEDAGRFNAMRDAWLAWGRGRGLV